ncbi:amidohydrolase family protein [Luteimonas suaedae]|uniref:amidohydrolase family protein n=1 Tax=Luteimonas suaedae TaxID=2605430 RepID=UPI0011EF498F|nr:amidohydrolase family protein [Luteimonas suaedae]
MKHSSAALRAVVAGAVVCAAFAAFGAATADDPAAHDGTPQVVTVDEGTNLAATVSPDGQAIVMDLQGVLWRLPASGGKAERITDSLLEPARPDWSPAQDLIAFQAFRDGNFNIWTVRSDGEGLQRLTSGHGDHRDPRFSPDGATIAFASDRAFGGSYDIWTVDRDGGEPARITDDDTIEEFEPAWSPDGTRLAFVSGTSASGTKIEAVTLATGERSTLVTAPEGAQLFAPSWSPDGATLAYVQLQNNVSRLMVAGQPVGEATDVFPFPARWLTADTLLYTGDGGIRTVRADGSGSTRIPFEADIRFERSDYPRKRSVFDSPARHPAKGIVGPALSPDGTQLTFQALNQIWVARIGGKPRALTDDSYYKADPAWSPDGERIAYSSDKAGTQDLYVHDLATGDEQRVTSLPGAEVSAAWSPGGNRIAFQDETGATQIVELSTGNVTPLIPSLFAPGKPSWSANGNTVSIAALKPYSRRFREGTSQILTADVASGELQYWEPAPFKSLSTRGEDGPVYSPDGSALAFVMESALWTMPVDGDGYPAGPARQLTSEVTDAPTWSGDSRKLLYLSNGRLRMVSRDGGRPEHVPLRLGWQQERNNGRTIIHAGRLWDGRGPEVQTNVDITVVNSRIVHVQPHRDAAHVAGRGHGTEFVDASQYTVLPGLWESHTHEWISGKFFGARLGRLWLAYGVTSLQSVGDPVYRAVETREAYASGQRVGPRFFASGEAIDGERVYYNFMRPVTGGDRQLARELQRADALDYDMLKTYVRLPHEDQALSAEFAHEQMGVWAASHYMLPGLALNMDGMTHLSATSRLGFAYTRSLTGATYGDVVDLLAASRMFVISTTFNPSLYAEDPEMVEDPRLLALNPPWEQAALRAKRDLAVGTDQSISLERLRREEETLAAVLAGGGSVLAGTDSPLDNPAVALHLNLRAQVKYGMAPWQALQSATLRPAQEFGVAGSLGSVERGKLADLVFVAGDPLQDIADLANVQAVMKNGRMYGIEELMAPFASTEARRAAAADSAAPAATHAASRHDDAHWWHDPELWQGPHEH